MSKKKNGFVSMQLSDSKAKDGAYRMRQILRRCNYTSDEIAEELGIPYTVICDILSGEEEPVEELIEIMSAYLGLDKKFFLNPWQEVEKDFYRLPMYLYRLDEETEWYRFKQKDKKDPEYRMAKDYFPKQDYIQKKMEFYESAVRRYIGAVEETKVPLKYSDKELQYRRGREFLNICTNLYKSCFELSTGDSMTYYEAVKRILKCITEILQGKNEDDGLEKTLENLVDAMKEATSDDVDF